MVIGSFRFASALFIVWSFLGGLAFAQQAGNTSGPASGTNVQPSTAIQKETGRSVSEGNSSTGAGAPGVEGKPGAESGRHPKGETAPAK